MLVVRDGKYKDKKFKPEQVSAMVLSYLKECADMKCVTKTNKVVITVPISFYEYQRRATMDAAKIADLDPICVISEQLAACIAYAFNKGYTRKASNVLVYDFGGGKLDASLIRIQGGDISVIATAGDPFCGGVDIDQEIFKMAVNKMTEEGFPDISQIDPSPINKIISARSRLLKLCEEAKKELSSAETSEIILTGIVSEDDKFVMTLKRSDIDMIISKMENRLIEPIEKVLKKNHAVDELIFIGGSSKIPRVKNLVESKLNISASALESPEEAVALGGSIYGAYKLGAKIKGFPHLNITDVTPMAICFGLRGCHLFELIPRNTPKPYKSDKFAFQPSSPYARSATLTLYECDTKKIIDAYRLGSFEIMLPERENDNEMLRIFQRVEVNDNEIALHVSVVKEFQDEGDPIEKSFIIKNDKPLNEESDIIRMKNENKEMMTANKDSEEKKD